ncbi:porin family protein [Mesorhizobium sp. VK23B]|uniref:Porin family protein n=2 Tax=Mesorhizobium dulcispinae TaxID=3072316 RepID=A0ABU4XN97_9HYPH|nr:porin family protein [Mesorhizobium sp. VK23B]MDX8475295.1 porin family protein [Mesorhizobium sp. VK23A]
MRSLAILFAGLLALLTGSAMAADAVEGAPAEGINWSGAYIGAVAGYGWKSDTYHYSGNSVDFDSNGFVGGVTAGYNWQRGQIVFGVEGDISYADMKGSVVSSFLSPPCFIEGCTAKVDWFGTGRARVGYSFENFLPYATGGFAVGHVKGSADIGACGLVGTCSYSDTRWGWSAGAGVEWAMNQQISFKAEYLHVDLGRPSFVTGNPPDPSTDRIDFDTVRIGINYHF